MTGKSEVEISAEMVGWNSRVSRYGSITAHQYRALKTLLACRDEGFYMIRLDLSTRTINSLLQRGWVRSETFPDGSQRYCITGDGEKIAAWADERHYRRDGLCPACGTWTRLPGRAYCRSCQRAADRYHNQLKRRRKLAQQLKRKRKDRTHG